VGSDVIGHSEAADIVRSTVRGVTLSGTEYCRSGSNAAIRWFVDFASDFLIQLDIMCHYNTLSFVCNVHFILIPLLQISFVIRDTIHYEEWKKLKNTGDKASPSFKPFLTGNMPDKYLPTQTLLQVSFRHISISLTSFTGYQTLWEYNTRFPSQLNHKLSWSIIIIIIIIIIMTIIIIIIAIINCNYVITRWQWLF
jgi:flagellar biosynthesis protein FlhB